VHVITVTNQNDRPKLHSVIFLVNAAVVVSALSNQPTLHCLVSWLLSVVGLQNRRAQVSKLFWLILVLPYKETLS